MSHRMKNGNQIIKQEKGLGGDKNEKKRPM